MDFLDSMTIAASGMKAQSARMKVLSENIANADSLATSGDGNPYRRQIPSFSTIMDRENGLQLVQMGKTVPDQSEFGKRHDPNHPSADAMGYVKTPNVNVLVESIDMRQAQRSYEANLNVIDSARQMMLRTIDLLQR